jgi:hypothetical protein
MSWRQTQQGASHYRAMYKHRWRGRLVVIGKYAKPRCFENADPNNLSIIYERSTKA